MQRALLIVLMSLPWIGSHAAPTAKVNPYGCATADPNKISLFVQLNPAVAEIEGAARAACSRGETFILYPGQTPRQVKDTSYYFYNCGNRTKSNPCKPEEKKEHQEKYAELTASMKNGVNKAELEKFIKNEIVATGRTMPTFTISSHHVSSFYGQYGRMSDQDFKGLWTGLKQSHPDFLSQVSRLQAFGCYTAKPDWFAFVDQTFTHTPFVYGGYVTSGAHGDREAAGMFIEDLLNGFETLSASQEEAGLCSEINALEGVMYLNAGVMVRCDDDLSVGYQRSTNSSGTTKVCESLDEFTACAEATLAPLVSSVSAYVSGANDIPAGMSTQTGEMRNLYSQVRAIEHCGGGRFPSADTLLLLVFYQNVKINFSNAFAQEITEFEATVNQLKRDRQVDQTALGRLWIPNRSNLLAKSRGEIIQLAQDIRSLNHPSLTKMGNLVKNYLHQMKETCMNASTWHEPETVVSGAELRQRSNSMCM